MVASVFMLLPEGAMPEGALRGGPGSHAQGLGLSERPQKADGQGSTLRLGEQVGMALAPNAALS